MHLSLTFSALCDCVWTAAASDGKEIRAAKIVRLLKLGKLLRVARLIRIIERYEEYMRAIWNVMGGWILSMAIFL